MRFIKFIIISVLLLGLLITAIASLFPSRVIVSRALEINSTPAKIAYYTADLTHWHEWMSDWKDNNVQIKKDTAFIGSQTISLISKNDTSVTYSWITTGQPPYKVMIEWIPLQTGSYVIHWSFEQNVSWYPWEKFRTLLNEKLLGSKMETELQNLQTAINERIDP